MSLQTHLAKHPGHNYYDMHEFLFDMPVEYINGYFAFLQTKMKRVHYEKNLFAFRLISSRILNKLNVELFKIKQNLEENTKFKIEKNVYIDCKRLLQHSGIGPSVLKNVISYYVSIGFIESGRGKALGFEESNIRNKVFTVAEEDGRNQKLIRIANSVRLNTTLLYSLSERLGDHIMDRQIMDNDFSLTYLTCYNYKYDNFLQKYIECLDYNTFLEEHEIVGTTYHCKCGVDGTEYLEKSLDLIDAENGLKLKEFASSNSNTVRQTTLINSISKVNRSILFGDLVKDGKKLVEYDLSNSSLFAHVLLTASRFGFKEDLENYYAITNSTDIYLMICEKYKYPVSHRSIIKAELNRHNFKDYDGTESSKEKYLLVSEKRIKEEKLNDDQVLELMQIRLNILEFLEENFKNLVNMRKAYSYQSTFYGGNKTHLEYSKVEQFIIRNFQKIWRKETGNVCFNMHDGIMTYEESDETFRKVVRELELVCQTRYDVEINLNFSKKEVKISSDLENDHLEKVINFKNSIENVCK